MTAELYSAIAAIAPVYDTDLPQAADFTLTTPIICATEISAAPSADGGICLDGRIAMETHRVSLEVHALDIAEGRTVRDALKAALHGWQGGAIKWCAWELTGPELWEDGLNPPRYVLPIDFMLTY